MSSSSDGGRKPWTSNTARDPKASRSSTFRAPTTTGRSSTYRISPVQTSVMPLMTRSDEVGVGVVDVRAVPGDAHRGTRGRHALPARHAERLRRLVERRPQDRHDAGEPPRFGPLGRRLRPRGRPAEQKVAVAEVVGPRVELVAQVVGEVARLLGVDVDGPDVAERRRVEEHDVGAVGRPVRSLAEVGERRDVVRQVVDGRARRGSRPRGRSAPTSSSSATGTDVTVGASTTGTPAIVDVVVSVVAVPWLPSSPPARRPIPKAAAVTTTTRTPIPQRPRTDRPANHADPGARPFGRPP